ncbi:alpha/beta fold hydrolase [Pedococcus ginsenosidimutans]|uniref:alpha/beta fold hydrolase n=1 Tax=Pedococcus ginsenosidimutans TaxID=490570 RepID=UPI0031F16611
MARRQGRVARLVAGGAAVACLAAACTTQPGGTSTPNASSSAGTQASRTLAGKAMVACTISGEQPVKAQAAALCGVLPVPEDRSRSDGRRVGLRVAVVPAVRAPSADPVFVLAGGPGDAATQFFAWLPSVFKDLHAARDIVLVDQRGTGSSNRLTLPQLPTLTGLSARAANARLATWSSAALASVDADPRFYTTTVAADDLDAVRAALGYTKIDLYGTSYGGTVAQYYLRQHGDRVRAAVLDGTTPVDVPVLERIGRSSQAALDLLFRRCAADTTCHRAFPRLATEWAALLQRFAHPVTVVDPASGASQVVDKVMLAAAVHSALLTEQGAAQLPLALHLAFRGRLLEAGRLIGTSDNPGPTLLMADEVTCSESWARYDPAEVARQGEHSYALARELALARQRQMLCAHLPEGVVRPDDGAAVRTATPVLWVVGDGDPQDPPANLGAVPAQQPHSRIVVVQAQQHVVGHLGCVPAVIAAFLHAGSADGLDVSCIARTAPAPAFRTR